MGASDVRTSLNVHRNVHLRSYKALTLPYLHDILPFRHTSTPLCGESPQILTSCRRSSRWWRPGQRWAWPPHNWWQSAAPTQAECEWDRWRTCSGVRCMRTCSCEGREGNMWVHSNGEHEPTCACRHEAGTVSLEARMCVCDREIMLLTCKKVCHYLGGTCTFHRSHTSSHVRFRRACVSAGPEVPPCCLQREQEREGLQWSHFNMEVWRLGCAID